MDHIFYEICGQITDLRSMMTTRIKMKQVWVKLRLLKPADTASCDPRDFHWSKASHFFLVAAPLKGTCDLRTHFFVAKYLPLMIGFLGLEGSSWFPLLKMYSRWIKMGEEGGTALVTFVERRC